MFCQYRGCILVICIWKCEFQMCKSMYRLEEGQGNFACKEKKKSRAVLSLGAVATNIQNTNIPYTSGVNDVLVENTPVALAKHLKHEKKGLKEKEKEGKKKLCWYQAPKNTKETRWKALLNASSRLKTSENKCNMPETREVFGKWSVKKTLNKKKRSSIYEMLHVPEFRRAYETRS